MKPLPVFLDTSALPRHLERPGGAFEVLAQYAETGIIKTFVSEVCCKEWSSQLVGEIKKHLEACNRAIDATSRGPMDLPSEVSSILASAASTLTGVDPSIEKLVEDKTFSLLKQLGTDVLPISAGHGSAVMAGYFAGTPPFSGRKERKDIPDAFVFEALKELRAKTDGPILAVVHDKRLADALEAIPDVTVYPTLRELLGADDIVSALKETKFEALWETWFEHFCTQLPNVTQTIRDQLINQIEKRMALAEVESDLIPSDNNTAIITGTAPPEDLELDWEDAQRLGAGWVSVPFRGTCSVLTDFDVYRSDAYNQPDWVTVQTGDPEKQHYFDAQAYFLIEVSGAASIQFDKTDIIAGELGKPIDIEVDELEFHVEDHD